MMKKILIIRFSSIGDIVLTSAIIRCIKNQIHKSEVHFLTKKSFSSIVLSNPHISKVYTIEKSLAEVLPQLRAENYSIVVDLHFNTRSILLSLLLRKPSMRFSKQNLLKWLLVNLKTLAKPSLHLVDRYFIALKKLGIVNDGLGLDFFIEAKNEVVIHEILPANFAENYIAIVIGAKHFTKRFPAEKLIELCNKVTSPFILIGSTEDQLIADEILKKTGEHVISLCGKLNLQQSASVIRQAKQVISNDTGLMHIAAAFQKNIISIWGNTVPEFGMYPYFGSVASNQPKSAIIEVQGLSCRPCSKIGFEACPKGHFRCMHDIEVGKIIANFD